MGGEWDGSRGRPRRRVRPFNPRVGGEWDLRSHRPVLTLHPFNPRVGGEWDSAWPRSTRSSTTFNPRVGGEWDHLVIRWNPNNDGLSIPAWAGSGTIKRCHDSKFWNFQSPRGRGVGPNQGFVYLRLVCFQSPRGRGVGLWISQVFGNEKERWSVARTD